MDGSVLVLKAECIHFGLGRARDKLSRLADSGKLSCVSDRVRSTMMHDAGCGTSLSSASSSSASSIEDRCRTWRIDRMCIK